MLQRVIHRVSQAAAHLTAPSVVDLPASLAERLTPPALEGFQTLSPSDQRHLIDVATNLAQAGASSDIITAGLLHDIGKSFPPHRIRLHHRVAKVLIQAIRPEFLDHLRARSTPPRGGAALWVLARHPQLGADLAEKWGYSDHIVWLIAHHEDSRTPDRDLQLLIQADAGHLSPRSARMLSNG